MAASKKPAGEIVFDTHIGRLEHLIGMHYLHIPKSVVQKLGGKLSIRLVCTVNGIVSFQCGLMALGEGKAYISINAARMKKAGLQNGDNVKVSLRPDKSKYGMEVPRELAELFRQDPEAKRRFDMLSPGKQRYVIYYVSGVKNPQLRIDRSLLLLNNLKLLPEGKETFRGMLGKDL